MMNLLYIATGLLAGVFSGFLGLGGGLILIPILTYGFGLTQHQAQGTSLAVMIPPITLLAAMRYYYSGNVKLGIAVFIAAGSIVGGLVGAHVVQRVPEPLLRKSFGVIMLFVALRMVFFK